MKRNADAVIGIVASLLAILAFLTGRNTLSDWFKDQPHPKQTTAVAPTRVTAAPVEPAPEPPPQRAAVTSRAPEVKVSRSEPARAPSIDELARFLREGERLFMQGNCRDALAQCTRGLELQPDNPGLLNLRSRIRVSQSRGLC